MARLPDKSMRTGVRADCVRHGDAGEITLEPKGHADHEYVESMKTKRPKHLPKASGVPKTPFFVLYFFFVRRGARLSDLLVAQLILNIRDTRALE